MLKSNLENGSHCDKTNWAYQIKNILQECGLFYIWQNQSNMPFNLSIIRQRILDIFYQSWYSYINNSSRLETYNLIKHTFKTEEYLDFVKEKKVSYSSYKIQNLRAWSGNWSWAIYKLTKRAKNMHSL